jgi:UDP-N-acetylmuramoyl-L-alanyl-D-glutamate--2,6-diaminopimelate ligase
MYFQKLKNIYHLIQSLGANIKYGFPSRKLKVIGVTGTDGKTTSVTMIYHILKRCGLRVGMISTVHIRYNGREIETGLHVTTPDPWETPRILREMADAGIEYVVVEATSSGLDQNRLFSIKYDASLVTFIGADHLDYHGSQEAYSQAKFKIIKSTVPSGLVVLNKDHHSRKWLRKAIKKNNGNRDYKWFSIKELSKRDSRGGTINFVYRNTSFHLPIIGEYNYRNTLGVIKICERYVDDLSEIAKAVTDFKAPLGRMQIMQKQPFVVIVDFAHTPESLSVALKSVKKMKPNKDSKIITLFGCAGQRDHGRRKMGAISGRLANITLISIEDPRNEDLRVINDDIISQAEGVGCKVIDRFGSHQEYRDQRDHFVKDLHVNNLKLSNIFKPRGLFSFDYAEVQNRIDAIDFAFKLATKGDIIFITGKAHEQSLAIGRNVIEYKYSDINAVQNQIDKK